MFGRMKLDDIQQRERTKYGGNAKSFVVGGTGHVI